MTYVTTRTVPWMNYMAEVVDEPMSAADAIKAGGLDFTVSLRNIQFQCTDGSWKSGDQRKAVVRDDNEAMYEVVSDSYAPLQYADAFAFLDAISPKFVAAGSIKSGRQGFVVIELPEQHKVHLSIDDPHEMYVMVRTSHDRSRGIEVSVLPLRQKCMNSLTVASMTKGAPQRWSISHLGDVKGKMHNAEKVITGANAYAAEYERLVDALYKTTISTAKAETILKKVIRKSPKQDDAVQRVLDIWTNAETVQLSNTGWGLVNAVSDYFEWNRQGGTAQSQILGVVEGVTTKAISRTAELILA